MEVVIYKMTAFTLFFVAFIHFFKSPYYRWGS